MRTAHEKTEGSARKASAAKAEPAGLLGAFTLEETRELKSLAVDLNAAADRMGSHLDRAIEAVRASLDPEREAASRRRYEAEFAGSGETLLTGLQ
jgi:hypothetical protein